MSTHVKLSALISILVGLGAACSFDSRPFPASDPAQPRGEWKPPSAAMPVARVSSDAGHDAAGSMSTDAGAMLNSMQAAKDSGVTTEPGAAIDAAVRAQDAAVSAPRDASVAADSSVDAAASSQPDAQHMRDVCRSGSYAGPFGGDMQASGIPITAVIGVIDATMSADASGAYLEVLETLVLGTDQLGNQLAATLSGRVDCTSGRFEAVLSAGEFLQARTLLSVSYTGSAEGTYRSDPPAIDGTWKVEATEASALSGNGTFALVHIE